MKLNLKQGYWSPLPLHLAWCYLFPRDRNSIINVCQLVLAYRTFFCILRLLGKCSLEHVLEGKESCFQWTSWHSFRNWWAQNTSPCMTHWAPRWPRLKYNIFITETLPCAVPTPCLQLLQSIFCPFFLLASLVFCRVLNIWNHVYYM